MITYLSTTHGSEQRGRVLLPNAGTCNLKHCPETAITRGMQCGSFIVRFLITPCTCTHGYAPGVFAIGGYLQCPPCMCIVHEFVTRHVAEVVRSKPGIADASRTVRGWLLVPTCCTYLLCSKHSQQRGQKSAGIHRALKPTLSQMPQESVNNEESKAVRGQKQGVFRSTFGLHIHFTGHHPQHLSGN